MITKGVWVPIITPFGGGKIDFESYKNLLEHYINLGVTGIIPNATTGENPNIEDNEEVELLEKTLEIVNHRVPVLWGVGGNSTKKVIKKVEFLNTKKIDGILLVSPYYNRPNQNGIYEHFKNISEHCDSQILIYNIPYRTGRNMENETILKLSNFKNITGVKDSCGDIIQSIELIREAPKGFNIFTGEDILFYTNICHGGAGGVLASSHIQTEKFLKIWNYVQNNDHKNALPIWNELSKFIPFLFKETNPGPIKYLLKKENLISSSEIRLPLTSITLEYEQFLDKLV